jgi:dTDP-4-dehydrorhamnose reductase
MKYLIIGNKGTLGNEFQALLGTDTSGVDRDELDITDQISVEKFITEYKPEVIINCAAYTNVDGAETDPETAELLNATALEYLCRASNEVGATLIHFSTGMVFPDDNQSGYNEDALPDPINKYGETKLSGEKIIHGATKKYYLIRTQWLYGKPQSAAAKKSFIELIIELGKSGKVKAVTDEVGKPTWSKDLAAAVIKLINSGAPFGIYHLVNEGAASRMEWTQEIYKILNMAVEVTPVSGTEFPRAAARGHYELLNNTKFENLRPWQEALKEYLS